MTEAEAVFIRAAPGSFATPAQDGGDRLNHFSLVSV